MQPEQNPDRKEHCRAECSRKGVTGGRPCGALNWIPHTKGCMLFEVGYDKRLIMPSSHVHFLVNKCAEGAIESERDGRSTLTITIQGVQLHRGGDRIEQCHSIRSRSFIYVCVCV
ncbi:hypothetical protein OSTOST_22890 [Ostertagia ostertagi]